MGVPAIVRRLGRALAGVVFAALLAAAPAVGWANGPAACGAAQAHRPGPQDAALANFARDLGLVAVAAFVGTANTIHNTGGLPDCYLIKAAAEARGWRPSFDLWRSVPGAAIGGDRFANREGRLPAQYDGRYREADLDYDGGHRGPKRLIYVEGSAGEWLQWVTIDHYRRFYKLPDPE